MVDKSAPKQIICKVLLPLEVGLEAAGIPTCIGVAIWQRTGLPALPYIAACLWVSGVTLAIVSIVRRQPLPRLVYVVLYCLYLYVAYLALVTLGIV